MSPEEQASLLNRWLTDPAGQEPPEGLDADVVEAVYALRPERAPAPRVSIDDILAGVSSGVFAAPQASAPAEQSPQPANETQPAAWSFGAAQSKSDKVVELASARRQRNRVLLAIGSFAAAAMVLFTVMPLKDQAEQMSEVAAPALPAPSAEPTGADQAQRDALLREQPAAGEPAEQARARADLAQPPPPATAAPAAPAEPRAPMPSGGASGAVGGTVGGVVAPTQQAQSSSPAPLREEYPDPSADDVYADESLNKTVPADKELAAATTGTASTSPSRAPSAARQLEELEEAATEDVTAAKGSRQADEKKSASRAPAANASNTTTPALDSSSNLDSARSNAYPGDYNPSWYASLEDPALKAEVEKTLAEARALGGAAAAPVYARLINSADTRVGQDFAYRASEAARQAGQYDTALSYVTKGLSRSRSNTPFRAMLLYQQGRLYEAKGDPERAATAYQQAAALNGSR